MITKEKQLVISKSVYSIKVFNNIIITIKSLNNSRQI